MFAPLTTSSTQVYIIVHAAHLMHFQFFISFFYFENHSSGSGVSRDAGSFFLIGLLSKFERQRALRCGEEEVNKGKEPQRGGVAGIKIELNVAAGCWETLHFTQR